ncbi:DUF6776 family protein [Marinicellulosiphila megalodicopiae]|uniref:DUF6776 family protein n=1 Tax=Marinicellulosiphila megalodicopiae TaxID=2724896 RepID=UPI003BB162B0
MSNVKGSKIHSINITERNPIKIWGIRAVYLLLFVCACAASYVVGYTKGDTDGLQAQKNIDALAEEILDKTSKLVLLNQQFVKLQEQYTHLELAAQIDASQVKDFQLKEVEQLDEVNELRSQLSFYQSIMSPSDLKKGLTVEQFEIEGSQQIKAILTQVTDKPLKIMGDFQILVTGLLNNEAKVYNLSEISSSNDRIKFGFKYFQRFNIDLDLPDGFEPLTVEINAKQTGNNKTISKSISWPKAN